MAKSPAHRSEQPATLIESQKGYDIRIIFFHFLFAVLIAVLAGGLVTQQIFNRQKYTSSGERQSQRRVVIPGPRGEIYDRHGRVLATNQSRFSAVLYIDELRPELTKEMTAIGANYRKAGAESPTYDQRLRIARTAVVQRYLDKLNELLGRPEPVTLDPRALANHFSSDLLIPFTLVDELTPDEYARLIERLPVTSPLQTNATTGRFYPFGDSAAHVLGRVKVDDKIEIEDFYDDLRTFTFPGIVGDTGLEKQFNGQLDGQAGGRVILVDPHGYTLKRPDDFVRKPVQGKSLTTSIDIELQQIAEDGIGDRRGSAVVIDVNTGEVLVLASKPDYDPNEVSPRIPLAKMNEIFEKQAWFNRAIQGLYPPGSTFKLLTSIAGLRSGAINPNDAIIACDGYITIGGRKFYCDSGNGHHDHITLADAITKSCDIYYYEAGRLITPARIAEEGRRFHMFDKTGIELPGETGGMVIPDPEWKQRTQHEAWYAGDTANMAIGQGYDLVSPLEMATFLASIARNEVTTKPTLIHNPNAPRQQSEPIGLTPEQRAALLKGMEGVTTVGTASLLALADRPWHVPGVRIAGKTGTAQKDEVIDGKLGKVNYAWFVGFAPAENPQVAFAVLIEPDEIGEMYGGQTSGPIAGKILRKYFEQQNPAAGR